MRSIIVKQIRKNTSLVLGYIALVVSVIVFVALINVYQEKGRIQDQVIDSCQARSEPIADVLIKSLIAANQTNNVNHPDAPKDPWAPEISQLMKLPPCEDVFK